MWARVGSVAPLWAGSTASNGMPQWRARDIRMEPRSLVSRMAQPSFNPEHGSLVPLEIRMCTAVGIKTWLFDLFTAGKLNSSLAFRERHQVYAQTHKPTVVLQLLPPGSGSEPTEKGFWSEMSTCEHRCLCKGERF